MSDTGTRNHPSMEYAVKPDEEPHHNFRVRRFRLIEKKCGLSLFGFISFKGGAVVFWALLNPKPETLNPSAT